MFDNTMVIAMIPKEERSMDYKIIKVKMDDEFKICPSCGYKDGFHSMFKKDENVTKWLFICPSCHKVFDIGRTLGNESTA